eukprot:6610036-Prymnesium_polylepis.1
MAEQQPIIAATGAGTGAAVPYPLPSTSSGVPANSQAAAAPRAMPSASGMGVIPDGSNLMTGTYPSNASGCNAHTPGAATFSGPQHGLLQGAAMGCGAQFCGYAPNGHVLPGSAYALLPVGAPPMPSGPMGGGGSNNYLPHGVYGGNSYGGSGGCNNGGSVGKRGGYGAANGGYGFGGGMGGGGFRNYRGTMDPYQVRQSKHITFLCGICPFPRKCFPTPTSIALPSSPMRPLRRGCRAPRLSSKSSAPQR